MNYTEHSKYITVANIGAFKRCKIGYNVFPVRSKSFNAPFKIFPKHTVGFFHKTDVTWYTTYVKFTVCEQVTPVVTAGKTHNLRVNFQL